MNVRNSFSAGILALLLCGIAAADASKTEIVMFGGTPSRNMVSDQKNLPEKWDVESGENIKWTAKIGSQTYAGPIVAGGKVFVGTNNEALKNPKLTGDRGNVMAFDAATGKFLWQSAHAKLGAGRVNDWPLQGVCSTPVIEGDRLYYVSNRAELVAVDTEGFLDGENDGPFSGETEKGETDADFIWILDMIGELDVFPHNLAASSPLLVGDLIFLHTGNGVDEGHINIPSPDAPSFIAVNKKTGKLVWEDNSPGENVLHGQWSSPSHAVINGKSMVFFPGGNGWLYAMEAETGKPVWQFDLNPKDAEWELGGSGTRNYVIAMPVVYDGRIYIGVGQDPEHGEAPGHLYAIDPTKEGDVTEKAVVWHLANEKFNRTLSSVAGKDGLIYAADLSGNVYCADAKTGEVFWVYETFAAIWGSPYLADGKVYIGDEDGDVAILREGKKKEVIAEINMGAAVYTTPWAKDGVLYIATREKLFAVEAKK
jgi:outer membrane protein assembly factor BamB